MQSQWLYQCFGGTFFTGVHANSDAFFIHKFQDGGPIPEVVIILRLKTTSRWSQRLRLFYRARRQYPISENSIRYKPEVETVPKTGCLHLSLFSEVGHRRLERSRTWNSQNIVVALEIASISVSVSELLKLSVCTWWCSLKSEVSMPVKVDWACPKTLPQPLRSRNPGVDPFLDYYLYILEKFSICIGMPNFTSVALIVSKLCLRDCQIVHDSWSVGLFWCFMFHE